VTGCSLFSALAGGEGLQEPIHRKAGYFEADAPIWDGIELCVDRANKLIFGFAGFSSSGG
jgi:hypothetical protein